MGQASILRAVGLLAAGLLFVGLAAVGCEGPEPARAPGPLRVVVTIPPLQGLAKALAPADAEVVCLLPPGRSEHGYELTPSDMAALQRADVIVLVGLGLEPKVESFLRAHPSGGRRVVEFAEAVGLEGAHGGHDHAHHDHGDHDHDGHDHGPVDPHLWLDPALVTELVPEIARSIREVGALSESERAAVGEREAALLERMREAEARWQDRLRPVAGRSIVTHHAAWGRLADRYGLEVAAVIRPTEAQEPSPGQIEAAVRAIRERGARAVFVEPQFSAAVAERIAGQAGVAVGTLDPLGDGDWFAMMSRNVETLATLLADAE